MINPRFIRQPSTDLQKQQLVALGFPHPQILDKMTKSQGDKFLVFLEKEMKDSPERKDELFETYAPPVIPEGKDVYFVDGSELPSVTFAEDGCYCVIKNGEVVVDKLINGLMYYELELTAIFEAVKLVDKSKKPSVIFSDHTDIVNALNFNWSLGVLSHKQIRNKIFTAWNHGNRNRLTIKLIKTWWNPAKDYLRKKYRTSVKFRKFFGLDSTERRGRPKKVKLVS